MSEFSLDEGSVGSGVLAGVAGCFKYLVIPLLLALGLSSLLAMVDGQNISEQLGLDRIMIFIVGLGMAITVLCFFRGYYPRGSFSRLAFGLGEVAMVCLWIWMVTNQGGMTVQLDEFGATLNYTGLVLLFVLGALLKGVYFVVEMFSYRQKWLKERKPRVVIGSKIVP
jgi:hypothetical protein